MVLHRRRLRRHLARAAEYEAAGDWLAAEAELIAAERVGLDPLAAYHRIGVARERQRRWSGAVDAYEMAVEVDGTDPRMWFRLGHALERQHRWKAASRAYERAVGWAGAPEGGTGEEAEGDAVAPEWWFRLGHVLERQRRWKAASRAYERAVGWAGAPEDGPRDVASEWWFRLGSVLQRQRLWERASEAFALAVEQRSQEGEADDEVPVEPEWWFALGRSLEHQKRWPEATQAYERAVGTTAAGAVGESDAKAPVWWFRLGRVFEQQHRWSDAAEAYAVATVGEDAEALWHYRLGRMREMHEDWDSAERAYRAALEIERSHASWHFRLGLMRERQGNVFGAVAAYQDAVSLDGSNPGWFHRLGVALDRQGSWRPAAAAYRASERLDAERAVVDRTARLPYRKRILYTITERPAYAYIVYKSCVLARELGMDRISVAELGVAGGKGLLALEEHVREVEQQTGVGIDVYGFDTGEGLYEPSDNRDLPHFFAAGNYAIDVPALEARLARAQLILGDAGQTFADFLARAIAPIGALAFDMDLYSSTSAVLRHFALPEHREKFLPRVPLFFDDVVARKQSEYLKDYNDFAGELLAISDFNAAGHAAKIAEDRYFRALPFNVPWHHCMYQLHLFDHPRYGEYINTHTAERLQLPG